MGDIIFLQAYRRSPPPSDVTRAMIGMASGLHQMRTASRLLAEAVAELRALASGDAGLT